MYPKQIRASILLSFVLIYSSSIAQKNYVPATVVITSGDTLKGFIDYRNWEINPKSISFKKDMNEATLSMGINDIQSFDIPGKDQYIRSIVWKDMQPVDLNKLVYNSNDSLTKDTAFLRVLVNGDKISLYELVDEKEHFFIKEANDTIQELRYKVFMDLNDPALVVTKKIYIDQLKRYTFNNAVTDRVINKIEGTSYAAGDLSKVLALLNSNVSYTTVAIEAKQKFIYLFAGAGASYNSMTLVGVDARADGIHLSSPGFVISAGLDLHARRNRQNLFFRFELNYRNNTYKNQDDNGQYTLTMSTVNFSVAPSYTIARAKNFKAYLGLSGGVNFSSYPENTYTTTDLAPMTYDNFALVHKMWSEFGARAGFMIMKHFDINMSAKLQGGFIPNARISDQKVRFFGFSILYQF